IRAWMCQRWAQLDEGEFYLRCAENALEIETTPEPMGGANIIRGQICALRALFSLTRGQISQAIEYANQALEFLPEGYFNRPVAADALGIAKRVSGDFDGAIKVFVEARRDSLAVGNRILAQAIILELGRVQTMQGRLHQAAETFREAIEFKYQDTEIKIPYASPASVILANILREWNELDAAMVLLEEGIEIGLPAQMVDAVVQGYATMARVHLTQGNLDAAIETCKRVEKMIIDIPNPEHETMTIALNSQIRLLIAQDKLPEAERILRDRGLNINDEIMQFNEIEHIILARVWVCLGRENPKENYLSDAQGMIARLLEITEPVGCMREVIELRVLQALVFSAQGLNDRAIDSIEKALTLAEPERYVRTFVDEGEPIKELLRQVICRDVAPDYARKLLAAFEMGRPIEQLTYAQSLIDPLSKRELEVLRLLSTELSGPEIARELSISLNTMRTHTKSIYSKLDVNNRRAAVRESQELNIL
ncbi:MAG: hypothetical protein KAS36_11155, partial [Anaerolineales bacterium]|nr:hypothetical protein [Anaerolineales bacterium]